VNALDRFLAKTDVAAGMAVTCPPGTDHLAWAFDPSSLAAAAVAASRRSMPLVGWREVFGRCIAQARVGACSVGVDIRQGLPSVVEI
jgi:hypothetical protein